MFYERLDFTHEEHSLLRDLYRASGFTSYQAFLHHLLMQQARHIEATTPVYMSEEEEEAFLQMCEDVKASPEKRFTIPKGGNKH